METRDYLTMIGFAVTTALFLWKLSFDRDLAKVRETISYLEKRSEKLNEFWQSLKTLPPTSQTMALLDQKALASGFQQLEMIAYLVKRKAFDEETVYQVCWYMFDESIKNVNLKNWYDEKRRVDHSIYEQYAWLSDRWRSRIANEKIGNSNQH